MGFECGSGWLPSAPENLVAWRQSALTQFSKFDIFSSRCGLLRLFGKEPSLMIRTAFFILSALAVAALTAPAARAQAAEEETVQAASQVLKEVMAIPLKGIPRSLLVEAQGIAIIPGMIKGGFIVGVEHGKGVIVVRDKNGAWQSPNFITVTGGGIGWQAGVQATDVILVFRTQSSVQNMMRGKFTIGADASVAAGPVGRQASAATDITFKSEILSYSRSRGLFLGVSLDGAALTIDNRANAAYYGQRPGQPAGQYPQSALNLIMQIASYSNPQAIGQGGDREQVRRQLAESSQHLQALVDPQWQQYLMLPTEVYEGTQLPGAQQLATARSRFQTVATDPRFRSLADRHEFQETYSLLNRYLALTAAAGPGGLNLPPPPQ
jgi:lipid-binding SYLF domain-containing protein